MGKPYRLTPELQSQICGYVNGGAPVPAACVAAGVSWNTVKDWLRKGRDGDQPYADFVDAIAQAKARWEAGAALRITKAADKDWKAAAWLLERRKPETWAQRSRMEVTGANGGPVRVTAEAELVERARAALTATERDDGET